MSQHFILWNILMLYFFKLLIKMNKIHTATQPLYAIDGMTFIICCALNAVKLEWININLFIYLHTWWLSLLSHTSRKRCLGAFIGNGKGNSICLVYASLLQRSSLVLKRKSMKGWCKLPCFVFSHVLSTR